MGYCPECGSEVSNEAKFCAECGTDIAEHTPSKESKQIESANSEQETEEDINYRRVGAAFAFSLIPAFGAYAAVSIALNDVLGWVFIVGIPVFGYFLYQRRTKKAMLGGVFYFLAIETLLTPLVFAIYTFVFASQETATAAESAGAAIGGFILVVIAFVVGVPLAGVLYLISGRLDTDETRGMTSNP